MIIQIWFGLKRFRKYFSVCIASCGFKAKRSVKRSEKRSAIKSAKRSVKRSAKKSAKRSAKRSAKKSTKRSVKRSAKKSAKKSAKRSAKRWAKQRQVQIIYFSTSAYTEKCNSVYCRIYLHTIVFTIFILLMFNHILFYLTKKNTDISTRTNPKKRKTNLFKFFIMKFYLKSWYNFLNFHTFLQRYNFDLQ